MAEAVKHVATMAFAAFVFWLLFKAGALVTALGTVGLILLFLLALALL